MKIITVFNYVVEMFYTNIMQMDYAPYPHRDSCACDDYEEISEFVDGKKMESGDIDIKLIKNYTSVEALPQCLARN